MDGLERKEKLVQWIGKYKYILLVLLIGVALMLIPDGSKKEKTSTIQSTSPAQQASLSEELAQILKNIQGAGRVQVMLTLESSEQTVYQTDKPSTDRQDTVIITNENREQSGLVQQVISATYRGAIILCQGADSPTVRLAITDAVSKVTGLDSSQISILKMK